MEPLEKRFLMATQWRDAGVIGYEAGGYYAETSGTIAGTPVAIYAKQSGSGGRYIDIAIYNAKTGASVGSSSTSADAYHIYSDGGASGWTAGTAIKGVVFDSTTGYIYVLFTESGDTYEDSGFGIAVFRETSSGTAVSYISGDDNYQASGANDSNLYYDGSYGTEAVPDFFRYPAGIAIDNNLSTTQVIITGSNMVYNNGDPHEGIGDDAGLWDFTEASSGGALSLAYDQDFIEGPGTPSGNFGAVAIDPNTHDVFIVFNGSSILEGNDNGGDILTYGGSGTTNNTQSSYSMGGITCIGVTNTAYIGYTPVSTTYPLLAVLNGSGDNVDAFYFNTSIIHLGSTMTPYDVTTYDRAQLYMYMDPNTGDFATVDLVTAQIWNWNGSGFPTNHVSPEYFTDPYASSPYSYASISQPLVVMAYDSTSGLGGLDDLVVLNNSSDGVSLWGES